MLFRSDPTAPGAKKHQHVPSPKCCPRRPAKESHGAYNLQDDRGPTLTSRHADRAAPRPLHLTCVVPAPTAIWSTQTGSWVVERGRGVGWMMRWWCSRRRSEVKRSPGDPGPLAISTRSLPCRTRIEARATESFSPSLRIQLVEQNRFLSNAGVVAPLRCRTKRRQNACTAFLPATSRCDCLQHRLDMAGCRPGVGSHEWGKMWRER